jgi:hypothetical protein
MNQKILEKIRFIILIKTVKMAKKAAGRAADAFPDLHTARVSLYRLRTAAVSVVGSIL